MPHRFVVVVEGRQEVYEHYEDIPDRFDRVIEFVPEIPPGPHTDEQHEEIESWVPKFKRLLEKQNARSG